MINTKDPRSIMKHTNISDMVNLPYVLMVFLSLWLRVGLSRYTVAQHFEGWKTYISRIMFYSGLAEGGKKVLQSLGLGELFFNTWCPWRESNSRHAV
jgi:hypothetical protein